jgi:hypothetical protein
MNILKTIKSWFTKTKDEVEPKVKQVVVVNETQAIETRLAEVAEEKKVEEKVTAKEIKAKVKKKNEPKVEKPTQKAKSSTNKTKAKPDNPSM